MRKSLILLSLILVCPCLFPAANASAQSTLIPAGTLLHCTIDDTTISPKTAQVGDPVLCHLSQFTEFGRTAFPRGSYLGGHLQAAKPLHRQRLSRYRFRSYRPAQYRRRPQRQTRRRPGPESG